ncbi:hypothetical protein BaRGS_00001440 [Batillaria attramentaria]|uniref:G-protein coupled receptors family 1 profile domain-containing protein n=1 Tax=Batillaria attramentaria TaxID=370345 RepID=A0ABD0M710_9CAEN
MGSNASNIGIASDAAGGGSSSGDVSGSLPAPAGFAANTSIFLLTDKQRQDAMQVLIVIDYTLTAISLCLTVCNMVVFLQKDMKGATSTYVIGLSIAQVVFLLIGIVFIIIDATIEDRFDNVWYWGYYLYVGMFLNVISRRGSYLTLCLVSMDRLHAVLRPFHVQEFLLSKYPARSMLVVFVVTAIWHLYIPTGMKVAETWDESKKKAVYKIVKTDFYFQTKNINDGFGVSAKIVLCYVALLTQISLNVLTIWALRRHNMAAKNMQMSANEEKKRQKERALTITLLGSTICYVIFSLPFELLNLLQFVFSDAPSKFYSNLFEVMSFLTYNLTVLGGGIDFLCFFILSANYRKVLSRLLGCSSGLASKEGSVVSATELT